MVEKYLAMVVLQGAMDKSNNKRELSMSLSVIGAGFGRTGTMSLKKALETLGLSPCHHMEELFRNPWQLPFWERAAKGKKVDWSGVFQGYSASVDWPSAHYWKELAAFYPESKVVLSVRPPELWWESFSATIKMLLEVKDQIPDEYPRAVIDMADGIIREQTFGGSLDKDAVLAAFQQRIDDVKRTIPPERLLIFEVTQGWQPLCQYLDVPVPDEPFPRTNAKVEFWDVFSGGVAPGG